MSENASIEQPEQPDDLCGCGDPACPSGSFEKATAYAKEVPIRVVRQDDEVYVNLEDLASTVMAAAILQITANNEVNSKILPPQIIALLNESARAIAVNLGQMLHEEDRYIDPKNMPDTVPDEWLK